MDGASEPERNGRSIVIAAGGTGGHMFPAQALADALLARGWRVTLSTDARGSRFAGGFAAAVARRETSAASFSQGGFMTRLRAPLTIYAGVRETRGWLAADRPDVVAGFGGYPSFPALAAAGSLRIPRMIHEQNGVLGRVNRLFARRVDAVACGVWPVSAAPRGAKLIHIGNPIREAAKKLSASAYAGPGPDGPLRLVVFGGSQGAGVFGRLVPAAVGRLPEAFRRRLSIAQQVRPEDMAAVTAAYEAIGARADLAPFFSDLPERMAGAHLVIARAGASTLAEICAIGRPSLLAPYPHAANDHQTANAETLASRRAAEIIPDADTTPERLATRLGALFSEPARLEAMAAAARSLGRPGAAEDLADLVETLARARR